jgi:hypothetical protein
MKERRKKMNERRKKDARRPKKPYTKPEVKQVQLRPEEAVLAVCKLPGQYGPTAMGCKIGPQPCFATKS